MDKLLDNPWFLRLAALFLAVLLFYTVKADQNEERKNSTTDDMEVIHDVPVEVYYDDENLIVSGIPETVKMTIEGPSNIVQSTKLLKDYTVFVDLRSLPTGEHQVRIEHENISDKLQVRMDPSSVTATIEEKITKSFHVEPELNERLLAEGYFVSSIEVDPSKIEITGAKSLIDSISYVKATVTAEADTKDSFEQETKVRVLDRDLNKIDVQSSPEKVTVKVHIEEHQKEVPIVLNQVGKPAKDVTIESIEPETDRIVLSGPNRILDDIRQFSVDVDVSKITKSGTVDVKLKQPSDITKMSLSTLKVRVKVKGDDSDSKEEDEKEKDTAEAADEEEEQDQLVTNDRDEEAETEKENETKEDSVENNQQQEDQEQEKEKTIKVNEVPIKMLGLKSQFTSTFIEPTSGNITLTVSGKESVVNRLSKADFAASIDLSGASEGEETYPIIIEGPSDTEWTASVKEATIKIELA
ncbi:MAG TPA: CdaR family protein [Pseudogracilibacillus sp.]|nr:CdaR family protein [Pseudogracilibacillus sp.]